MRWYTRNRYYWNNLQTKLLEGSTTNSPDRTQVERVGTMVSRLATINNIFPFPLTVHTTKHIMKLLQGLLESILHLPYSMVLLHLLKEVRHMEP